MRTRFKCLILSVLFALFIREATAQTANVYLGNTDQTIRGFGGMNFPRWIRDLSQSEVNTAFGNGNGQLGLSILRVSVPPNSGNWSGEVTTAQRAKSLGAIVFATPWSPPASMKSNGSTTGGSLNTSSYGAYANHLRDFTNYMASNGASLYAISVQNEPDFVPNYESCGWTPTQMRTFLDNNASVIPTRIIASETVHPKRNWFDALSSSSEIDIYGDHLYGRAPERFDGKERWMTEHYTPNSNANSANNWPEALKVGEEVHNCMINGYTAYIWWYIRRSYGLITEDGNVSKRGFVMGHFSKFVRPGFVRVRADANPASGINVTSYQDGNTLVVVAINQNSSSRSLTLNFSGGELTNITKWETTGASGNNINETGNFSGGTSFTNNLSANSITTFRGTIGGNPPPPPSESDLWLEAECGSVGATFNQVSDANASGDAYVTVQPGNNSTSGAPGTDGQVAFTFNAEQAGNYSLWARVITPNGDDDSFWVQMDGGPWFNWNQIGPHGSWEWEQAASYDLSPGLHTLVIGYREDGALLDKLYLTTGAGTPSGEGASTSNCEGGSQNVAWLEAECGAVGSSFDQISDSNASGSAYVTVQPGNNSTASPPGSDGQISYAFNVAEAGNYELWARVITPNATDDSFWIQMDGGAWLMWNNISPNGSWTWEQATSFSLSAGSHMLTIGYREDGALLDKIYLTSQGDTPSGIGQGATNCSSSNRVAELISIDNRAELPIDVSVVLFPNPVEESLVIQLNKEVKGKVQVSIFNVGGVEVKTAVLANQVQQIDVSDLSKGMYLVRVIGEEVDIRTKIFK